jgi:hypothetical protein
LHGNASSTGRPWAIAQQLAAILVATLITVLWSTLARRTEYDRFAGWCRIVLRYHVGVIMLIYGGFKIIPSQFPPIALDQYAQPLGNFSPMGLLWVYMGFSPVYATFAGLSEAIGGVLLFFRRTATLGALVVIAVMSNVALINYAYDVPVKQLSTNLLLGAAAIAAADLRRLVSMFVLNTPTPAATLDFPFTPFIARVRRFIRPIIIGCAIVIPLVASYMQHASAARKSPLYGIYAVDEFVRNGAVIPVAANESTRWRWLTFSRLGAASLRFMSDSSLTLDAVIDTTSRQITLMRRQPQSGISVLSYERRGDTLSMRGTVGADSVVLSLHRLDERKLFRLIDE